MSIKIDRQKCSGCGRCSQVCPGNLIEMDEDKKALLRYPAECWGCTACLKECGAGAIKFYLGADIGGAGGYMTTENNGAHLDWLIVIPGGMRHRIKINKNESNKY
ncbi:MAG: ferredoxin family protein [Thermincola sp.]|nr:ferredoxin family protein [Thermincola sp.]MDT3704950.1 ferredoxin family protein [Thermincola sp.]